MARNAMRCDSGCPYDTATIISMRSTGASKCAVKTSSRPSSASVSVQVFPLDWKVRRLGLVGPTFSNGKLERATAVAFVANGPLSIAGGLMYRAQSRLGTHRRWPGGIRALERAGVGNDDARMASTESVCLDREDFHPHRGEVTLGEMPDRFPARRE